MKNNIYKQIVTLFILMISLSSCDDYLDVVPKGVQVLKTIKDYNDWLNNSDLITSIPSQLNLLGDNEDNTTISTLLSSTTEKVYTWQYQFNEDVIGSAILWSNYYKTIYLYNVVINGVGKATDGTDSTINNLKAEALLGRSFEYLSLVNLYGKPYNETTANEDLAVPFMTSVDVSDPTPPRSSVQVIYDHIIADITEAIPNLPKDNSAQRNRGTVAAAYGVLARAYLYMGKYTEAAANAQLALDNGPNAVLDYSTMTDPKSIPHLLKRPDVIYARLGGTSYLGKEVPTIEFLKSFNKNDLRLKFYYNNLGDYSFTTRGKTNFLHYGTPSGTGAWLNWGISVAEMRLIIAEAAARANDLPTAVSQLDLVRKCRYTAVNYQKFESSDQEEVLNKVLSERTFEFSYCGMRWFDMRRLNAEGRMPDVVRYDGLGNQIAILPHGSNKYTLQIPIQVIYYNQDWEQNPQ
jgi:tetratricopeptide (TPR) repeat protein